ncbi:MAG: hypothetical protein JWO03_1395 [Bacteroidetes bacterium]|nr:hypothetical protein [Bacteroidota bacterium]
MQKLLFILSILLATYAASAQSDLELHVRKVPDMVITPDSLYFKSHTSRTFTISGIPAGCKLKAEFTGGDLTIRDNTVALLPFYIYRDSDVVKLKSKDISGYKTAKGDFYSAELRVTAVDAKGEIRTRLYRNVYVMPQRPPRNVQLTADDFDRQLKINLGDSTVYYKPTK